MTESQVVLATPRPLMGAGMSRAVGAQHAAPTPSPFRRKPESSATHGSQVAAQPPFPKGKGPGVRFNPSPRRNGGP